MAFEKESMETTRDDFLRGYSEYTGYSLKHCKEMFRALEKYAREYILSGYDFRMRGVFTISTAIRSSFETNDLNNGGRVVYPERRVPRCKFSESLLEKLGNS